MRDVVGADQPEVLMFGIQNTKHRVDVAILRSLDPEGLSNCLDATLRSLDAEVFKVWVVTQPGGQSAPCDAQHSSDGRRAVMLAVKLYRPVLEFDNLRRSGEIEQLGRRHAQP